MMRMKCYFNHYICSFLGFFVDFITFVGEDHWGYYKFILGLFFCRVTNIIDMDKNHSAVGWSGFASVGAPSLDMADLILYH